MALVGALVYFFEIAFHLGCLDYSQERHFPRKMTAAATKSTTSVSNLHQLQPARLKEVLTKPGLDFLDVLSFKRRLSPCLWIDTFTSQGATTCARRLRTITLQLPRSTADAGQRFYLRCGRGAGGPGLKGFGPHAVRCEVVGVCFPRCPRRPR